MIEEIAIVDKNDKIIGYKEKMLVHREGIMHRAFSVLILNEKREILLQRRAFEKYHSPGLWTNACCSHQRENETIEEAAKRRIQEELGIKNIDISEEFIFYYKCKFDNDLYENEIDHVYIGFYNEEVKSFNKDEVCETKWVSYNDLKKEIDENPMNFTIWFKKIMELFSENFIYNGLK